MPVAPDDVQVFMLVPPMDLSSEFMPPGLPQMPPGNDDDESVQYLSRGQESTGIFSSRPMSRRTREPKEGHLAHVRSIAERAKKKETLATCGKSP